MYERRSLAAFAVASTIACTTQAGSAPPLSTYSVASDAPFVVGPMAGRPAIGAMNGDLDANGRLDLVTGNCDSGDLCVFLGKEEGKRPEIGSKEGVIRSPAPLRLQTLVGAESSRALAGA